MSIESLRIHPAALEEAEAAADWYAQRSRRAAERFLDELDRAINQIGKIRDIILYMILARVEWCSRAFLS